jgi:hypothetical protein
MSTAIALFTRSRGQDCRFLSNSMRRRRLALLEGPDEGFMATKPTILLTGRNGQIGSKLRRLLPRLAEVVAPDRRELDLLNPDNTRRIV